jgi:hypothetical protein
MLRMNNDWKIRTLSHFMEHLVMATQIMKVPRSSRDTVVECGCYAGGSTGNLLVVCKEWWREHLRLDPPRWAGAGSGLGLIPGRRGFGIELCFTMKDSVHPDWEYSTP